ncbi:uncharacterized protein LOC109822712 isoform X1 [Asparagus officinalis]|uniref:uncharacterized protein LOC109822712 isoform X1 n=1 Tax=Asparagus officinalis TaxID=4686 RepID=UPI00098E7322|nr:uncharacterized protein LOC109822712 isoform X1 [Asparagus officinalis]
MRKSEQLYSRALSLSRCLQLQGGWLCSLTMDDVDGDEIKFSDWEVLEIKKKIVEVYGLQQQKLLPFCAECNRPMNFFLMTLAEAQERKKLPIRQEKIRSFEIRENLMKSLESKESESVTFKECLNCKYFVPC